MPIFGHGVWRMADFYWDAHYAILDYATSFAENDDSAKLYMFDLLFGHARIEVQINDLYYPRRFTNVHLFTYYACCCRHFTNLRKRLFTPMIVFRQLISV